MINLHLALSFIRHFFTAKRNGHGIHSPFAYELCEEVFYNQNSFYDFGELKKTRRELWENKTKIEVTDFGAGSKKFKSSERRISDIAINGISTTLQSEIFYKLINYLKLNCSVELGTSLGLNTLYFARANQLKPVVTIDGSKSLCDFAQALAEKHQVRNVQFINGKFDEVLPRLLETIPQPFFLYIDGNHTYEATIRYFNMVMQKKDNHSVIVFDDIYWSKGMTRAWEEIKKNTAVTLSIDAFYFGILFFRPEVKEKIDLKIWL
ncbi:MAG: class I SAM-dependent methyltransferase [Bacteroidota bacterium]